MRERGKWARTLVVAVFCLVLVSGSVWAGGKSEQNYLKIATGTVGGTWFSGGSVLASIITEKVEGVNASPTIGGGVSNCRDLDANRAQIGYSYSGTALDAWEGNVPFETPLKNLRYIGNQYIEPFHIIFRAESGIKTLEDLKGKSFSPGKEGFTGKIMFDLLLQEANMTYQQLGKASYIGFNDGADLMKDKHLDYFALLTMPPNAAFMDVDTFTPLDLLQVPQDILDRMVKNYGMEPWTIAANTYSGMKKDITTVGYSGGFYCNKDLSEELVYNITKAIWENIDRFIDAAPATFREQYDIKYALRGTVLPLHKGAYRYYKERGLEVPAAGMPID